MRSLRILAVSVLLAGLGCPPVARAVVHPVTGPEQSIQAAIDSCASGDTVLVAPGHYHERLVVPDMAMTLGSWTLTTGDTAHVAQTILDGDSTGTVLSVATGGRRRFALEGFTIQRGFNLGLWQASAIYVPDSADLVLRNLVFSATTHRAPA